MPPAAGVGRITGSGRHDLGWIGTLSITWEDTLHDTLHVDRGCQLLCCAAGGPGRARVAALPAARRRRACFRPARHARRCQGPSDASKRAVQSGRVVSPTYGEILLDPEPDQKLVRGGRGGRVGPRQRKWALPPHALDRLGLGSQQRPHRPPPAPLAPWSELPPPPTHTRTRPCAARTRTPRRQALLLSEHLRLDEVYCVELLTAAQEVRAHTAGGGRGMGCRRGPGRSTGARGRASAPGAGRPLLRRTRARSMGPAAQRPLALSPLARACVQLGAYSAEAALGVYLRERVHAAQALQRLLSLQLFNAPPPGAGGEPDGGVAPPLQPVLAAVVELNAQLLAAKEAAPGGAPGAQRNALLGAILDALQVWRAGGARRGGALGASRGGARRPRRSRCLQVVRAGRVHMVACQLQ